MKPASHHLPDTEDEQLQTVLSANQYAKYQGQRTAHKRQHRPGRRPPKA